MKTYKQAFLDGNEMYIFVPKGAKITLCELSGLKSEVLVVPKPELFSPRLKAGVFSSFFGLPIEIKQRINQGVEDEN